jgi:hypothetical protein
MPTSKQLANLIPWKKGQNGNPNGPRPGRPPGDVSLTKFLKKRLAEAELAGSITPDGRCNAEWLVDMMIVEAMRGNGACIREIWDRNDGKVPAPIETPPVTMETLAAMEERDRQCNAEGQAPLDEVPLGPEPIQ